MKNKLILSAGVITALMLAGCAPDLTEEQQKDATLNSNEQINAERDLLVRVVHEMRKKDPAIFDAQFVVNEESGERDLLVYKSVNDTVVTMTVPSNVINTHMEKETDRINNQSGFDSNSFGSAMAGSIAGMLLMNMATNAFSNPISQSNFQEERRRRSSSYNGAIAMMHQNMAASNLRAGKPIRSGSSSMGRALSSGTKAVVGRTSGGSFSSSARAGGFGG